MKFAKNFADEPAGIPCPHCNVTAIARFELYRIAYPATPTEPPHRRPHPYKIFCPRCPWFIRTGRAPRRRL